MSIKRIDIAEFVEFGFLQELNRLFLHPMGMALEVATDRDGKKTLSGIWDYRDDPEGVLFYRDSDIDVEMMMRVRNFMVRKHKEREKELGYLIQRASTERESK